MSIIDNYSEETNDIIQDIESYDGSKFSADLYSVEQAFVKKFPSLYCLKYKPIRRKPLTFHSKYVKHKHRPWQVQILNDNHPDKVIQKSRQLGLSEVGISEFIWFLDVHPDTKGMYTFPRDNQMKDFSNTRVTPIFEESEYLQELIQKDGVDNVALKQIGNSYLFMRSAWGGALGEGVDIDILGFDEYDRMKDNVELSFQEGLKSSRYGWLRRWSTPTIPGRGINLLYDKSDQQRYVWTCEHCGEKQFLTIEDNVIQIKPNGVNYATQEIEDGTFIIGCKKCKKELNRWGVGEWVSFSSQYKERRGYFISQLDALWISADDIMRRQFSYPSKQLFYNYVIGMPYASEGMLITDEDIRASIRLTGEVKSRTPTYPMIVAGIDWGTMNWMIILGIKNDGNIDILDIYWARDNPVKPLEPVGHFAAILRAYDPNLIIADSGYGADRNAFLFTQFPRAFYSCYWTTVKDAASKVKFLDNWNESSHEVTVDKTVKMSRALHMIKGRLIGVFPWNEKVEVFTKHLKNVRIMDEESGGQIYQIATRIGDDHLACCLAYALIGVDKLTKYGTSKNNQFVFDFI